MKKKISIRDIAADLGVAISTVSAVLNGKTEERRISDAMRDRVLEHAKKCGYQPNLIAQSLRTGKSKILAMLVEDIADPFFAGIARLVETNAALHDYKLFYSSTENDPQKARSLIKAFRDRLVDGFIIAPPPGTEAEIQMLLSDQVPMVLFDRYLPDIQTNLVCVDNYKGTHEATELLIEGGHQNIAFITLSSQQSQMVDRLAGYQKAIEDHHYAPCLLEIAYTLSEEVLVSQIKYYFQTQPQIDAVIFATNYLALNGLRALQELNRKIPDQVAVIGFDDNNHFSLLTPSISAIAQPIEQIAATIVKLLKKELRESSGLNHHHFNEKEQVILPTKLILRHSCPPRQAKSMKTKDKK
ncbi:transcriptional regulator, LacI family [Arachidicoccus rhizosphaerae]|jgi:LacI family transcriptional regulator|uniref:Transcriptional regulator, LacI family n=1 Tax=Arachidicoccus rhizosphaerae TaxID=551991 RepID=A0A1H4AY90_9BACT|nr:LacI family DNA-binding transcriptional regulator [Arachidicoccus rhizosphaerae]SEA40830.1 transcriptional regulator, LacI family [Arachidicoccus rhizosphaerae]